MEGKGTEKGPGMLMIYRNLIAVTIVVTVCILAGSTAMAQRHGGFSGGGFRGGGGGFGRSGFNSGGFRGGFNDHGFRGDRFRHRDFDDRFVFFGDFGDPFFYYPYPYYGYYPYGYYPYGYGYNSYDQPVYQGQRWIYRLFDRASPGPSRSCRVLPWRDRWREWQCNAEGDPWI
jgi:hypothetical protein